MKVIQDDLFQQALDAFDLQFKTNRRSIILRDCPECARSKYSVWMFRPELKTGRTGGQCWICGATFSSHTYLVKCGVDETDARKALGIGRQSPDLSPDAWKLPSFDKDLFQEEEAERFIAKQASVPSHFFRASDWTSHPAAVYARKRGAIAPLSHEVFIDPHTNAVAFPISCDGVLVGFQKRYVTPQTIKTRTDPNIPKKLSFIQYGIKGNPLCVVEGPFDAIAAAWFGYHAVCTMGAEVSRGQIQRIAIMAAEHTPGREVYIGFDRDNPGEIGARKVAKCLDAYGVDCKRVIPNLEMEDFSSMLSKHSGLELNSMNEMCEIEGLVDVVQDWKWWQPLLADFDYMPRAVVRNTLDFDWSDFKEDTTRRGKNLRAKNNWKFRTQSNGKKKKLAKKLKEQQEYSEVRKRQLKSTQQV